MIEVTQGNGPIVLGLPHTGIEVPDAVLATLNATGRTLADTDWHIHCLYSGLVGEVSTVRTSVHRYVIDVNRAPDGVSLYPGQNTTGLCPLTDFDGQPLYLSGQEPDADEIERRRVSYHAPYHLALSTELARVKAIHGHAVLYDCHSIRSEIPFLFDGRLADFNVGTNMSTTCAKAVESAVEEISRAADGYTSILNGRFKGGWTTRHYGKPAENLHAIQMELAQSTYMQEAPPWHWYADRAENVRPHLSSILNSLQTLSETGELS